jgi:hypothetical protein
MRPDQITELKNNDVLRGRLAKYLVRECLRSTSLKELHAGSDDEIRERIIEVVNHIDRLLGVIFASSEIVDALEQYDPVPEWDDPDWYDRITLDDVDQLDELIKNLKARTN